MGGPVVVAPSELVWSTSDSSVATVDTSGRVVSSSDIHTLRIPSVTH